MKKTGQYLFAGLLLLSHFSLKAQDAHFSQFYTAPLYVNPAFAGTSEQGRLSLGYRAQWIKLPGEFNSFNLSYDHSFENKRSSIGFLAHRDQAGSASLRAVRISAMYAYMLTLQDNLSLKAGFQLGYGNQTLNYLQLVFGDQLSAFGSTGLPSTEQNLENLSVHFVDFSSGLLLYSDQFWIGLSAQHLNRPDYSFTGEESFLPMRWSVHSGYKFVIGAPASPGSRPSTIHPAVYYSRQGERQQLDIGLNAFTAPLLVGVWYRGLPLQTRFSSALVLVAGFEYKGFNFIYSHDMPVGKRSALAGGAHELGLSLKLDYDYRAKRKKYKPAVFPSLID